MAILRNRIFCNLSTKIQHVDWFFRVSPLKSIKGCASSGIIRKKQLPTKKQSISRASAFNNPSDVFQHLEMGKENKAARLRMEALARKLGRPVPAVAQQKPTRTARAESIDCTAQRTKYFGQRKTGPCAALKPTSNDKPSMPAEKNEESEAVHFETDPMALRSILSNTGISRKPPIGSAIPKAVSLAPSTTMGRASIFGRCSLTQRGAVEAQNEIRDLRKYRDSCRESILINRQSHQSLQSPQQHRASLYMTGGWNARRNTLFVPKTSLLATPRQQLRVELASMSAKKTPAAAPALSLHNDPVVQNSSSDNVKVRINFDSDLSLGEGSDKTQPIKTDASNLAMELATNDASADGSANIPVNKSSPIQQSRCHRSNKNASECGIAAVSPSAKQSAPQTRRRRTMEIEAQFSGLSPNALSDQLARVAKETEVIQRILNKKKVMQLPYAPDEVELSEDVTGPLSSPLASPVANAALDPTRLSVIAEGADEHLTPSPIVPQRHNCTVQLYPTISDQCSARKDAPSTHQSISNQDITSTLRQKCRRRSAFQRVQRKASHNTSPVVEDTEEPRDNDSTLFLLSSAEKSLHLDTTVECEKTLTPVAVDAPKHLHPVHTPRPIRKGKVVIGQTEQDELIEEDAEGMLMEPPIVTPMYLKTLSTRRPQNDKVDGSTPKQAEKNRALRRSPRVSAALALDSLRRSDDVTSSCVAPRRSARLANLTTSSVVDDAANSPTCTFGEISAILPTSATSNNALRRRKAVMQTEESLLAESLALIHFSPIQRRISARLNASSSTNGVDQSAGAGTGSFLCDWEVEKLIRQSPTTTRLSTRKRNAHGHLRPTDPVSALLTDGGPTNFVPISGSPCR